ncbi:hypothetical protein BC938DRAFT_473485 [Jimgerdemannia flammicorona]|uniref:Uncharacterized protein n=1 Tax=Jimgerdemannia flammicorona TaxID=994334 RepID=A0A433QTD5_9FUNG|nr:hypothetical protein BC938DRAFT_473485 [Jimgerdemannia flammicorona]
MPWVCDEKGRGMWGRRSKHYHIPSYCVRGNQTSTQIRVDQSHEVVMVFGCKIPEFATLDGSQI